jgi:hypothetical protein
MSNSRYHKRRKSRASKTEASGGCQHQHCISYRQEITRDIIAILAKNAHLPAPGPREPISPDEELTVFCPFCWHAELSLYLFPRRQLYQCERCGAQGDVITFLVQIEGFCFDLPLASRADRREPADSSEVVK